MSARENRVVDIDESLGHKHLHISDSADQYIPGRDQRAETQVSYRALPPAFEHVEQVVAEDEGDFVIADEVGPDRERLRQPIGRAFRTTLR